MEKEIDLHGKKVPEARRYLVDSYNRLVGKGGFLLIVHGYGSSGQGGRLRSWVRKFFKKCKIEFECPENNQGQTRVKVGKTKLVYGQDLKEDILKYCSVPKTKKKLYSKFHKDGCEAIDSAFKALQREKLLLEQKEGKEKKWQKA